jgi:hypothetical protein
MKRYRHMLLGWLLWAPWLCVGQSHDWIPLAQQDFQFKEVPGNAAAAAVLLYHADYITYVSDYDQSEFVYNRIKILTDAGKSQGNIAIPLAPWIKIHDLQARTIHPDGSISDFNSKPFEKVILKGRDFKYLAETFALPDVTVGSIIEYRYRLQSSWIHSDHWELEHDLFTVREHFLFKHDGPFAMSYVVFGSKAQPVKNKETYELELSGVPPFSSEEQMPAAENYKAAVRFFYGNTDTSGVRTFWVQKAKQWSLHINNFIGDHKDIRTAAAAAIGNATDPEEKLRRLYARAQEIRNLGWEGERSSEEARKEHLTDNESVVDVLKHGYGYDRDITEFFVAMARASGFEATVILVASRERRFFQPEYLVSHQYHSSIAGVVLNGKNLLLEPATRFCPFGSVRWINTETSALKVGKERWTFFIMPQAGADRASVLRSARATLDEEGSLHGRITVTFEGGEALERQLFALQTDDAGRNKSLEEEVASWLPPQSSVKMLSSQGWQQTGGPVIVDFEISVPGYAVSAGNRLLMPATLFATRQKDTFKRAERKYPVYFHYAFSELNLVVIGVPAGFALENLPETIDAGASFGSYRNSSKTGENQIITSRVLTIKEPLLEPQKYPELKDFFSKVQNGDESQLVLKRTEPVQLKQSRTAD